RGFSSELEERLPPGIADGIAEILLDAQQLVVFRGAVGTRQGAGLDLHGVGAHGDVRDGGVLGLARTVRYDRAEARALRELNGGEGFGNRADLVHLDQDRVRRALAYALAQQLRVRDEYVVAHDLDLLPEPRGEQLPARPVGLPHAVLDRNDRVLVGQIGEVVAEFLRAQ